MTRYQILNDGEGLEVDSGQVIRFACCDCGLVHLIALAIEQNGKIGFAVKRDNRATAQRRRAMKDVPAPYSPRKRVTNRVQP